MELIYDHHHDSYEAGKSIGKRKKAGAIKVVKKQLVCNNLNRTIRLIDQFYW